MSAKNLKILFLTGTPCSKDPFELVPCFNMLAGKNLLPTAYDTFYNLYVDRMTGSIINKNKLSNRILGLVSHVTHNKNSQPVEAGKETTNHRQNRDAGWFPECMPTIVSYVEMSSPQYKQYLLARDKEEAEKGGLGGKSASSRKLGNVNSVPLALPNSEKKSMGSYYVKSRMISNFSPLREYRESPIDAMPNNSFNETTSPKLKLIADRIHAAKGSVLVYSQFINNGGLKPLTKFLQNIGMIEFTIDDIKKNAHILHSKKLHSRSGNNNNRDNNNDGDDDDGNNIISNITTNEYIGDTMENLDNLFAGNDHIFDISPVEKEYIDDITSNEEYTGGGKEESCNVCTETNNLSNIENLSNEEFENHYNKKSQHKKKYKGGSEKTYVIYGADLYFSHLEHKLKGWKKITKPDVNKEVSFAWGNLLPNFHYDRNFFNQKAKLKNILMNSKSIISDKSKLYKTCAHFMNEGKYIPKTYNLHTVSGGRTIAPSKQTPYIVKDATSFGQKGVHIITSTEELEKYQKQLRHTSAIVSEYLTTPLLWGGKKFHFRIYVCVYVSKKTGNRFVKVFNNSDYAYKVFMAGSPFVADNYHDDSIHITGRKSTLKRHQWKIVEHDHHNHDDDFYFPKEDLPTGISFSDINKKIDTMFHELIDPHLDQFEEYPECDAGFEIFGADVMLDHRGEPYVLEINAKIGYSEDYGEKEGSKEYHEKFSHDFFDYVINAIHSAIHGSDKFNKVEFSMLGK